MSVKPSVSYGHGFLDDCGSAYAGSYVKTQDGQTLAAIVVANDDVYDIEATGSVGNKLGYYSYPDEGGANNLGLSSTVYTKIRYRVKCGGGGVTPRIVLVFSDASTQTILADGTTSPTWKTAAVAITPGKTIDHVRLYCNSAIGHIYYDFVLIYTGDFTLPNTRYGQSLILPGRYGKLNPVGMAGQYTQNLGTDLAEFQCICDLDIGNWKRAADVIDGEVFADILHHILFTDWVWLRTGEDIAQFKASLDKPEFHRVVQESTCQRELHLLFFEYRRSSADAETYDERWGLNS